MVIKHTMVILAHHNAISRLMFHRLGLSGNQSLATHVLPLDDIYQRKSRNMLTNIPYHLHALALCDSAVMQISVENHKRCNIYRACRFLY